MSTRPLGIGAALALVFAAVWVALTAATGKTYHVAPLVVAATPGWTLRFWHEAAQRSLPDRAAARAAIVVALIGIAGVTLGSLAIVAVGAHPSATILPDQPGGVRGETALFGVLGLFIAVRNVARASCRGRILKFASRRAD